SVGRGEGRSKKQAEQAAARMAWERLAGAGMPTNPVPPPTSEEDDA
ncbi:MAG: putative dsRNA-binding protein, partial [Acidimicrobiales bacterium]